MKSIITYFCSGDNPNFFYGFDRECIYVGDFVKSTVSCADYTWEVYEIKDGYIELIPTTLNSMRCSISVHFAEVLYKVEI